jgi:hypothetical protein
MPTLILWRWLSPTQLSLVPKAGREGLATACLTGAAVVAPAGMAVEMGTVAARVLVAFGHFPFAFIFRRLNAPILAKCKTDKSEHH